MCLKVFSIYNAMDSKMLFAGIATSSDLQY